jgi:hypothetical protein
MWPPSWQPTPNVGPGLSDCTFCHSPGGAALSTSPTTCSSCHSTQAAETVHASEAPAGIADQLDETVADMSLTCIACHTDVEVRIKTRTEHALEFIIGADA